MNSSDVVMSVIPVSSSVVIEIAVAAAAAIVVVRPFLPLEAITVISVIPVIPIVSVISVVPVIDVIIIPCTYAAAVVSVVFVVFLYRVEEVLRFDLLNRNWKFVFRHLCKVLNDYIIVNVLLVPGSIESLHQ